MSELLCMFIMELHGHDITATVIITVTVIKAVNQES